MNLTLPKRGIVEALSHVERIIPNKTTNPAYSQVYLTLENYKLDLIGSNGDVDILAELTVDGEGGGSWSVPATPFVRVLKACPGELVELRFEKREVHVLSGSYKNRLQLTDTKFEYHFEEDYQHQVTGLHEALESVIYAAATQEHQALFRGVLFQPNRVVATDGFRLALHGIDLGGDIEAVVPASALATLSRLLEDSAKFKLSKEKLEVQSGNYWLKVKTMEGSFPDFERVIPTHLPVRITVDAEALTEAVNRVAVMADSGTNNRIDLIVAGEKLTITTEGGYGGSEEQLEVTHEGEDMTLAYNAKYLLDPISRITGKVELAFSGGTTPTLIKPAGSEGQLAMVVPLRIG